MTSLGFSYMLYWVTQKKGTLSNEKGTLVILILEALTNIISYIFDINQYNVFKATTHIQIS